jgi:hypothetical protein
MDDIILEARKQAVLGGLERISTKVVAFERQQQELAHLQKMLSADADQLQGLANQIDNALTTAKMWVASSKWLLEDANRLLNLQQTIDSTAKVAERLGELAKLANTRVEVLTESWQLPQTSDGAVEQLCSQATSSHTRVKQCVTWDAFRREVVGKIRPLFEEHLDMLEGAAFRVVGFDDGVAQDADDLLVRLDRISSVDVYLAIPSRTQAVRQVVARLVRMGFPGWSFWDLPLVAHEFGHIVALDDDVARELNRKGHPGTLQWRETILADAFATYTMGPSYAIAVLMLALDPNGTDASRKQPGGPQRAHLILEQLESMSGADQAYAQIAAELRALWIRVARPLSEQDVDAVEAWAEHARNLLKEELQIDSAPSYPEWRWNAVSSWPARLLDPHPLERIVKKEEDLLDLVNVAWVCRLRAPARTTEIIQAIDRLRKPVSVGGRRGEGSSPERNGP